MIIHKHPIRYPYKEKFSSLKMIGGFDGGSIYKAAKEEKYFLIIDEGTLADFLDDDDQDLLDQLIKIIEFDKEENLNNYLGERYGRFKVFSE